MEDFFTKHIPKYFLYIILAENPSITDLSEVHSISEGYEFVSWSNGLTDSRIELDLTNPTELVATFKEVEEENNEDQCH